VPLSGPNIVRIGTQAMIQNLGMGSAVDTSRDHGDQKNLIQEILDVRSQTRAPQALAESSLAEPEEFRRPPPEATAITSHGG
jgi:hypothetical protein